MSPDMIVQFQRKMGECCESKVGHWKREIEKAKVASLLLNEVREKQVGNHEDDVMRVDIDFSEETIRKYDFFEPAAFQFCQEHINRFSDEQDIITDQELGAAAAEIAKIQLPLLQVYYFINCKRFSLVKYVFGGPKMTCLRIIFS